LSFWLSQPLGPGASDPAGNVSGCSEVRGDVDDAKPAMGPRFAGAALNHLGWGEILVGNGQGVVVVDVHAHEVSGQPTPENADAVRFAETLGVETAERPSLVAGLFLAGFNPGQGESPGPVLLGPLLHVIHARCHCKYLAGNWLRRRLRQSEDRTKVTVEPERIFPARAQPRPHDADVFE